MSRLTMFGEHIANSALGGVVGSLLFEPQRNYNFSVEIDLGTPPTVFGVPLSVNANLGGQDFGKIGVPSLDQEVVDLALDSAFLPKVSFDVKEVRDVNQPTYMAGFANTEPGRLVVRDFILLPVMNTVHKWMKSVYDFETDTPGLPDEYKKSAHILLLGPFGTPERIWNLTGVWPSKIDFGNLDMADNNMVKISLELQYDSAVYVGSIELAAIQAGLSKVLG